MGLVAEGFARYVVKRHTRGVGLDSSGDSGVDNVDGVWAAVPSADAAGDSSEDDSTSDAALAQVPICLRTLWGFVFLPNARLDRTQSCTVHHHGHEHINK